MRNILLALTLIFLPQQAMAAALANSSVQYVDSTQWAAVAAYPTALSTPAVGTLATNTANSPAVDNERVYVVTTSGAISGTEPTLCTATKGCQTTDGLATWTEITGQPCLNGDTTNSKIWVTGVTVAIGQVIYDSTTGSCQIVTTSSGNTGASKPSFSATAGVTVSDGSNVWTSLGVASSYGAFAAPHDRIKAADASGWQTVVPATIYIGSNHAETQAAAMTLAGGQGGASTPNQYLVVPYTSAPPTSVTTGATVSTTGANTISLQGFGYYYGIAFNAGNSTTAAGINVGNTNQILNGLYFENSTFTLNNSSSSSRINIGWTSNTADTSYIETNNSNFTFGSTSQNLQILGGNILLKGGAIAPSGSIPTPAINIGTGFTSGQAIFRDIDLSALSGTLVSLNTTASVSLTIENCRLNSGVTLPTAGALNGGAVGGVVFRMHNCDSGNKNYRMFEGSYLGSIQTTTTTTDTTNPATDNSTAIAWQINSSSAASFGQPYYTEYFPITEWYNTTGSSVTAKIQIAGPQSLNNSQIWPECEYLESSSYPLGTVVTGRAASPLTTPSTWTTSTDSWNGSPTYKQYMTVSATPNMKGSIRCRIGVADPSITEYVSPRLLLGTQTSNIQYIMPGMGYVNEQPLGNAIGTIGNGQP
jgi:hypothetical protein